jgi:hypothetical protein
LKHLKQNACTAEELEKLTGIPKRTVYYQLEHLDLLKAVEDKNGRKVIAIELP